MGMSSICLTYRCTSSPHRHHHVVNCHLRDVFPLGLEGCTQLVILRRKWISATKCLIKYVPDVCYGGQIRGICWPIEHMDVFVTPKFSADAGDVRFVVLMLENGVALANEGQDVWSQNFIVLSDCTQITYTEMRCVQCPWDILAQTSIPLPLCATLCIAVMSAFCSTVWRQTRCRPSALWSWKRDSLLKRPFVHRANSPWICL